MAKTKKTTIGHSLPLKTKNDNVISGGYNEGDFGENYWLTPDKYGNRRIDRDATPIVKLVGSLVHFSILPAAPDILDIGAGPGNMAQCFVDAGYKCAGCEYSHSGIRLAKEHFGKTLSFCDLRESIPYSDGSFDFAYCVGVMSMIPRSRIPVAFSEMRRILRVGGVLLISLLNPLETVKDPHLTSLPYEEWRRLLGDAGLDDVTSLWPPQRHGIGMANEFCGIFRKGT